LERTSLLLNDSRSAGFLVVMQKTESVHLSLLLLRKEFQRIGIGSAVMRWLLLAAKAKQLPVTLSCFRSNRAALQFYAELGFSPVKQDDTFVELTSSRC
jgi:GNAT superfamily N-acetyltransferase